MTEKPEPLNDCIETFIEADYYEGTTIEHKAVKVEKIRSAVEWAIKEIDEKIIEVPPELAIAKCIFKEAFEDVMK